MTSHPGVGMGVIWWFIVGRGNVVMHLGGQWAWSLMIIGSDVSNQRGDVGVITIWYDMSG